MGRACINRYPQLAGHVRGELFPVPGWKEAVASATSLIWMLGLGFIFGGDYIIKAMGFSQDPEFYTYIKQNKMMVGGALFILNNIGSNMMNTGAFEVYINDELVYSKLHTGHPPSAEILFDIFKSKGISDGVVM